MSSIGNAIIDLGDKVAGDTARSLGNFIAKDEGVQGFIRSGEHVIEKYPQGKILKDYIQKIFEPTKSQIGQKLLDGKIASGIAPHIAAEEAHKEAFEIARKQLLGPNDEVLIKAIHSTGKQHGPIAANTIANVMDSYFHDASSAWRRAEIPAGVGSSKLMSLKDVGVKPNSNYISPEKIEKDTRTAMSWMYTSLVALPHLGQTASIPLSAGIKDTATGLSTYLSSGITKKMFMDNLIDSGALFDESRYQMIEDAKGGGLARKLFNHPGLGWVRRQGISFAAATADASARRAAVKLTKDPEDKWAAFTLAKLNINPQDVLKNGPELSNEQIQKAMYSFANETIYLKSTLKTPWRWEENYLARLNSQFRTYQFRQTKFLYETFKNSYKYGGPKELTKTIALFGTLFPVMGEIIHSLENISTAQNPFKRDTDSPTEEYFDAVAHVGGWGMFYSLWRSGMYNAGKGYLEGPLLNTLTDIFIGVPTDLAHHDKEGDWDPRVKSALKRVTSKLGTAGKIITPMLKEEKEPQ